VNPLVPLALAAALAASVRAAGDPPAVDAKDKVVLEKLLGHAAKELPALTADHFRTVEATEMLCWIEMPKMNMALVAYEMTGDPAHLRAFARALEDLRSVAGKGEDGFPGWYGKPIEMLRDPAKPGVRTDEIQADFRIIAVASRFLELASREEALRAEFAPVREAWVDLMEKLVAKWDARGRFVDLGAKGAIYRWHPDYTPMKADLTLPHEKQAILLEGLLNLWRATGNDAHLRRAAKLGAWFKRCLALKDDRYAWSYWDPAGPWDVSPKDPSRWKHWVGPEPKAFWYAATVGSAAQLYHHGVVFDAQDMARFVRSQKTLFWNGDAEAPAYFLANGSKAAENERMLAPALAPFDEAIAAFAYRGKLQEERVAKADSPWHGGVLAADWLRGKYVDLPRAKGGQPMHEGLARAFLAKKENRELLESLKFSVESPGWLTPPVPSQMPGMSAAPTAP
jgi:hypothetical protein